MINLSRHYPPVSPSKKAASPPQEGAPPNMLARHAVLLTPAPADVCLPLACPEQRRATPLESTLIGTLEEFILNNLKLFRINTYKKKGGKGRKRARFAQFWCNLNPFRINTSKSVSKQTTLSPFRMNTYEKTGEGGGSPQTVNNPSAPGLRVIFLSSLPRYRLTFLPLGAPRAPLATLFHPWHANDSANTSSPISTGAKRSRAPFAFRRIPWRHSLATSVLCKSRLVGTVKVCKFRSRGTRSIAGSKLEPAIVNSPSTFSPPALPSTPSKSIRRSSRDFAALQNNFPISTSSPATFSKRTSPRSLPAGASASTEIFPTTSPRRFFITSSSSPTSSTKFTSSSRPKWRTASPPSPAPEITAISPSSLSSTRAPNLSSKSRAKRSILRRKLLPPWSRSGSPANAQSSSPAPAWRQRKARRQTLPAMPKLVFWIL